MAFKRESVYCAVKSGESLNEIHINLGLKACCSRYEDKRARPGNYSKNNILLKV